MDHPFTFFERYLPGVNHHNLHMVTATFVVLLLALATGILFPRLRKAKENILPDRGFSLRNGFEIFMDMIRGLCEDIIGSDGRKYLPFIGTVFFFIFGMNIIGMIPGFLPPTENAVTGAAVATIVFIAFNYFGFQEHGLSYFKHFLAPVPMGKQKSILFTALLVPAMIGLHSLFAAIEVVGMAFRPVSLSIRLYGNIFGDHVVLGIFSDLVPWLFPMCFMVLGIFVSFMQAFIFMLLTIVYISGAVAHEH